MKITPIAILIIFVIFSLAFAIKIKNKAQNLIIFSTENSVSKDPTIPSVMEKIITSKSVSIRSRMVYKNRN
jgi:hypothetical protein